MNKRMEHCLYQAGLTASGCWEDLDTYTQEGIEKFAELIVAECASRLVDMDQQVKGQHNYYKHASIQVLLHFGIQP